MGMGIDTKVKISVQENTFFLMLYTPDYHKTLESWNSLDWKGTLKIF